MFLFVFSLSHEGVEMFSECKRRPNEIVVLDWSLIGSSTPLQIMRTRSFSTPWTALFAVYLSNSQLLKTLQANSQDI